MSRFKMLQAALFGALLVSYASAGVPDEWRSAGVYTSKEMQAWKACGIEAKEANDWQLLRVDQGEACELSQQGIDPDGYTVARRLKERTGSNESYHRLAVWLVEMDANDDDLKFLFEDARRLPKVIELSGGLEGYTALKKEGFDFRHYDGQLLGWKPDMTPQEAKAVWAFAAKSTMDARQIAKALEGGLPIKTLELWVDRFGVKRTALLIDHGWHRMDLPAEDILFWAETCSLDEQHHIEPWYEAGHTTQEAKAWAKAGLVWKSGCLKFDHIDEWKKAGVLPEEAKGWIEAFDPLFAKEISTILQWKTHGFTPKEAKAWKASGFGVDLSELAAAYKKAQVPPELAYEFARRKTPPENTAAPMQTIKSACKQGVYPQRDLFELNPYDIKGRCYIFNGSQTQLLSRNEAVYKSSILIRFGSQSAPNEVAGIVKGGNVHKGQNVLRQEVVLPTADFVTGF